MSDGETAVPETARTIEITEPATTEAPAVEQAPTHHALNDDFDETKTPQQRDVHVDGELLVDSVYAEGGYVRIRAHYEKSGEAVDTTVHVEEALMRFVVLGVAYKKKAEKAEFGMWKDSRERLLRTIKLLEAAIKEALVQQDELKAATPAPRIIVPDNMPPSSGGLIV